MNTSDIGTGLPEPSNNDNNNSRPLVEIGTEDGDTNNSNTNMLSIDQTEDVGDSPGSEETCEHPGSKKRSPPTLAADEHDERPNKRNKRSQGSDLFACHTLVLGIDGKYRHMPPSFSIGQSPIDLRSKKTGQGQRRNVEAIATWQDTVSDTISSLNLQKKVSWPWESFGNGLICKKPPRVRVDMSEHFNNDEEYIDWR
mmetsp:Transcript_27379/g.65697  ORF Transcript_27379/g.65697 Transcript_27379/m.65697 type:complete len:198 (-) Transcript_27379:297-890(-)